VARAGFVEVDQSHVEHAPSITLDRDLPSLNALHLAVALMLPGEDLVSATWGRGLHTAASAEEPRLIQTRSNDRAEALQPGQCRMPVCRAAACRPWWAYALMADALASRRERKFRSD
jgi:hypothetical protein